MTRRLVAAMVLSLAAAAPAAADGAGVSTSFAVLVGFPSGEAAAEGGALLVPGTVIPLDAPTVAGGEALVTRSLAFTSAVDKLWDTFRLDPTRRIQRSRTVLALVNESLELPAPPGSDLAISATLLGYNQRLATYRVALHQDGHTLADSTASVTRGGRAVVGAVDGEAAPYLFVVVEAAAEGDRETAAGRAGENGLTEPVAISKVAPKYPEEARAAKVQGVVVLETLIDRTGRVREARILESPAPSLAEAAIAAARQWRFEPARNAQGVAVDVRFVLTLRFALK